MQLKSPGAAAAAAAAAAMHIQGFRTTNYSSILETVHFWSLPIVTSKPYAACIARKSLATICFNLFLELETLMGTYPPLFRFLSLFLSFSLSFFLSIPSS
jgi:hypothetical protein